MHARTSFLLFSLLLWTTIAMSQQITSQTNSIRAEVNTQEIELDSKPQTLHVTINCDELQKVDQFALYLERTTCRYALISVKRNNEDLWLVKADTQSANEKVVAWNESFDEKKLLLYPTEWTAPYILDIELQVTMKEPGSLSATDNLSLAVEANYANQIFTALPSGRGTEVTIKNK